MTKVIIKGTNEIKELDYRMSGSPSDWASEILSNYDVKYNSEAEAFEMTSEEFTWWKEYFSNSEKDKETAAELGIETADYADRFAGDLGDEHAIWQEIFAEVKNEH